MISDFGKLYIYFNLLHVLLLMHEPLMNVFLACGQKSLRPQVDGHLSLLQIIPTFISDMSLVKLSRRLEATVTKTMSMGNCAVFGKLCPFQGGTSVEVLFVSC